MKSLSILRISVFFLTGSFMAVAAAAKTPPQPALKGRDTPEGKACLKAYHAADLIIHDAECDKEEPRRASADPKFASCLKLHKSLDLGHYADQCSKPELLEAANSDEAGFTSCVTNYAHGGDARGARDCADPAVRTASAEKGFVSCKRAYTHMGGTTLNPCLKKEVAQAAESPAFENCLMSVKGTTTSDKICASADHRAMRAAQSHGFAACMRIRGMYWEDCAKDALDKIKRAHGPAEDKLEDCALPANKRPAECAAIESSVALSCYGSQVKSQDACLEKPLALLRKQGCEISTDPQPDCSFVQVRYKIPPCNPDAPIQDGDLCQSSDGAWSCAIKVNGCIQGRWTGERADERSIYRVAARCPAGYERPKDLSDDDVRLLGGVPICKAVVAGPAVPSKSTAKPSTTKAQ